MKTVERDGIKIEISFQCGEMNYDIKNGAQRAKSNDLHQALSSAQVPQRKTNFLIRGVKQTLGL